MDLSPYLNLAFGVSALVAGLAFTLFFSERPRRERETSDQDEDEDETHMSAPHRDTRSALCRGRSAPSESQEHDSLITGGASKVASEVQAAWWSRLFNIDSATVMILVGFFIAPLRQILVFEILMPYASQRYAIRIAQVNYARRSMRFYADIPGILHTLGGCPCKLGLLPHSYTKNVEVLNHNHA
jgi:uncharacterized membrane protein YraQ (UPF0718 family)